MLSTSREDFPLSPIAIKMELRRIAKYLRSTFPNRLTIVGIESGGTRVVRELEQELHLLGHPTVSVVMMTIQSYDGTSRGKLAITGVPHPLLIESRDVVIFDDIIDTANTVSAALMLLASPERYRPRSINIGALLMRETAPQKHINPELVGFTVPSDAFVVGHGMDYKGQFREEDGIRIFVEPVEEVVETK